MGQGWEGSYRSLTLVIREVWGLPLNPAEGGRLGNFPRSEEDVIHHTHTHTLEPEV